MQLDFKKWSTFVTNVHPGCLFGRRPSPAQNFPTASQYNAFLLCRQHFQSWSPVAIVVRGGHGVGKKTVVRAALRSAGKDAIWHTCMPSAGATMELERILERVGAAVGEKTDSKPMLVVVGPESIAFPEAFTRAVKREAARAGICVTFIVDDSREGDSILSAFCSRTHHIRTVAPVTVQDMTEQDAIRFALVRWEASFPSRCLPNHLPQTMLAVADGRVCRYDSLWDFVKALYADASFVSPQAVWKFRRSAEDDGSHRLIDSDWPPTCPFFPGASIMMESRAWLEVVAGLYVN
jgi:hypothetical protein